MGPNFSKDAWFKVKPTLPVDFPNLPYLYDGDVKISQSVTIMRYLGRKFGFWPDTEQQAVRVDLIEQQLVDWRGQGVVLFYNDDYDKLKDGYINALPTMMQSMSKFLGTNDYFAGNKLTYVDFLAYEWLDVQKTYQAKVLDATPNLVSFVKRIESIPKVKAYMSSDKFMKWPINNNQAKWGSRLQPAP